MTATIKVPVELRDRINRGAKERGVTPARLIEGLLDEDERRRRIGAFGEVIRRADGDYWDEFHDWDATMADGRAGD